MIVEQLKEIAVPPCPSLRLYRRYTPEVMDQLSQLAPSLRGLRVVEINATANGGGVSELLRSRVPFMKALGIDDRWVVPEVTNPKFFEFTKGMHNALQGKQGSITDSGKDLYLQCNKEIAELLGKVPADVIICHDPQTAAIASYLNSEAKLIWRCHIDTSQPDPESWEFIRPFLNSYDRLVFTLEEYADGFDKGKLGFITPVIDPLAPKNKRIGPKEAEELKEYLRSNFGINPDKPLVTQVSRFDPWKNPMGVLEAYFIARRSIPDLQLALVGNLANDDPEGIGIYNQVVSAIGKNDRIFPILRDDPFAVRAFQAASDVIIQNSTREGFGLTVTEALWQGAVVIGGRVGGIKIQIEDGRNGFLVDPTNLRELAEKIVYVFDHPKEMEAVSRLAHESVRQRFLLPHNAYDWSILLAELTSLSSTTQYQAVPVAV